eukprot:CAMPEP_0194772102 /NCGR_PEP_ID=MMETSP0323_2-20130528/51042_1 /TAXON_ID=2866 ORGANISM="Crypthecodinium cohnii, Strain Seligo" /NCGR_SAMPLE_ID=MMETSP0323_2 /ASSEMBLY_ACC=CAM_ASM_000346 /LENGTH=212 /DNA_ID=CAMNT_0039706501 /DNA_START=80 /DNA_END=719 /DNA_ORIENTATION=+
MGKKATKQCCAHWGKVRSPAPSKSLKTGLACCSQQGPLPQCIFAMSATQEFHLMLVRSQRSSARKQQVGQRRCLQLVAVRTMAPPQSSSRRGGYGGRGASGHGWLPAALSLLELGDLGLQFVVAVRRTGFEVIQLRPDLDHGLVDPGDLAAEAQHLGSDLRVPRGEPLLQGLEALVQLSEAAVRVLVDPLAGLFGRLYFLIGDLNVILDLKE